MHYLIFCAEVFFHKFTTSLTILCDLFHMPNMTTKDSSCSPTARTCGPFEFHKATTPDGSLPMILCLICPMEFTINHLNCKVTKINFSR